MPKNVLVTGAAGFIASHLSELLLKLGDTVIGVDNINDYYSVDYKRENIRLLSEYPNFSFHELDICSKLELQHIFEERGVTHVAHLAARAGVRPSIDDPFIYQEANVRGTLVLLELARLNKVENFVLTSSSSVYGSSTNVPFREDDSATDRPISPYAATKKASEVLGYTYHHLYGLNVNVVRPFTVYGPRGRPDMAPWLFLTSAIRGTPIRRFGDGSTRRDYTYVEDFVQGFAAAIDRPFGFEIFNLGNSQTVSLQEALETIERVTGRPLHIIPENEQPGDVPITFADVSKAREKLGYNPTTSFEEGMTKFHEWYLKQGPGKGIA